MTGVHRFTLLLGRAAACVVLLAALPSYGQWSGTEKAITQYVHEVWLAEDGLPQNTVNALVQTSDGYLWLGTQEGLVRFDGVRFSIYDKSTVSGLKNHYIWDLHEDSRGRLWAGTNGGGIAVHDRGEFTFLTRADGLLDDIVQAVFESRNGRVWIGTPAGLNYIQDGRVESFRFPSDCPSGGVTVIREDDNGNLWLGTSRGLLRLSGSDCRLFTRAHGLAGNVITDLHLDSRGSLWVGTARGLSRVTGDSIETMAGGSTVHELPILSVREDRHGSIWVGTAGDGVFRIRDKSAVSYSSKDGFSDDFVASIWEDHEGSLWFGTYSGGLNRLKEGSLSTFTSKEGLSDDFVLSVYESPDGKLWIGTYGGGLNVVENDRITVYDERSGLAGNAVSAIVQDLSGTTWFGVFGVGLAALKDGKLTKITVDDGLIDANIHALHESRHEPGVIWAATDHGLSRYDGTSFTNLTVSEGLAHNTVVGIFDDPVRGMWFATGGGLSYYDGEHFRNYTTLDGLSHNSILSLHWDSNGNMWIGTDGGGLNRFDGSVFRSFGMADGLYDDVAFAILEDEHQNLWMSSNAGIYSVPLHALEDYAAGRIESIPSVSYGYDDGMKSSECNGRRQPSAWKGADGRLWFATIRGVVRVEPDEISYNTLPPPVKIEAVRVDELAPALGEKIVLGPHTDRIEFEYTALSYLSPASVNFRYKLEGYDDHWVEGGTMRSASYTNLPPGAYTFRVLAANNDGRWNYEGASLQFRVRPAYYETSWFRALVVAAIMGLVLLLYKFRIRHFARRTHELEATVSLRTKEIRTQKEMAEKANRLKSRLLSLAAHDLKNPLNGVRGFSQSIVNESEDGTLSEMANVFEASATPLS
ncbi:MAG: two-component regulator propeller domain-containing protein, partial [Rhodothermales bacterium]